MDVQHKAVGADRHLLVEAQRLLIRTAGRVRVAGLVDRNERDRLRALAALQHHVAGHALERQLVGHRLLVGGQLGLTAERVDLRRAQILRNDRLAGQDGDTRQTVGIGDREVDLVAVLAVAFLLQTGDLLEFRIDVVDDERERALVLLRCGHVAVVVHLVNVLGQVARLVGGAHLHLVQTVLCKHIAVELVHVAVQTRGVIHAAPDLRRNGGHERVVAVDLQLHGVRLHRARVVLHDRPCAGLRVDEVVLCKLLRDEVCQRLTVDVERAVAVDCEGGLLRGRVVGHVADGHAQLIDAVAVVLGVVEHIRDVLEHRADIRCADVHELAAAQRGGVVGCVLAHAAHQAQLILGAHVRVLTLEARRAGIGKRAVDAGQRQSGRGGVDHEFAGGGAAAIVHSIVFADVAGLVRDLDRKLAVRIVQERDGRRVRVAVVHPFGSAGGAGRREIDPIFIEVVLHDRDGGRAAGREVLAVDGAVVVKAHAHLRIGLVDGEVRFAIFFAFKCIGAEFIISLAVLRAFSIGICLGDVAGLVRCLDAQRVVVAVADVAVHAAVLIRAGPRGDRLFSFASAGVLPRITVKLRRIAVFVLDRRLDRDVADAALVGVLHRSGQGVDAVLRNRFAFLKDHVLAAFKQLVRNLDVDRALLCIVGVFFGFLREDRMHVRRVHVVLDRVDGGSGLVSGSVFRPNAQRVYAVVVEVIRVVILERFQTVLARTVLAKVFRRKRIVYYRSTRSLQFIAHGIRRCAAGTFCKFQARQDVVIAVVPAVSLAVFQNCTDRFLCFIIRARIRRILRHSRHRRHVQTVLDVNLDFLGAKGLRDVNVIGFLIRGSVVIQGSGFFRNRRRDRHRKLNRRVARDFIFSILSNCSSDREGFRLTGILTGNNLFVFCCFSVFCFYSCSYYHTI